MRKMRMMRNWAQLIFVARKMRKFAPRRKPVALETLVYIYRLYIFCLELVVLTALLQVALSSPIGFFYSYKKLTLF